MKRNFITKLLLITVFIFLLFPFYDKSDDSIELCNINNNNHIYGIRYVLI